MGKNTFGSLTYRRFPVNMVDEPGISGLPLEAVWLTKVEDQGGLTQILGPAVIRANRRLSGKPLEQAGAEDSEAPKTPMRMRGLLQRARFLTWRNGVCLLCADEFQNISTGETSAKATGVLLQLNDIGPLFIYCANFNLVNKLKRRKPQDQNRLLTIP